MAAVAKQAEEEQTAPESVEEAMEQAIARLIATAKLSPLSKITMEGHSFHYAKIRHEDEDGNWLPFEMKKVSHAAPLEALLASTNPITDVQYLAGLRWRMDWSASQISSLGAIDYTQAATYATEWMLSHEMPASGPRLAGTLRRAVSNPSDRKLDAMKRLGDAVAAIGPTSSWFARKLIGEEISINAASTMLGVDKRYTTQRLRETLDDLARHYGMMGAARQRKRGG